jgi:acyl carrier protein
MNPTHGRMPRSVMAAPQVIRSVRQCVIDVLGLDDVDLHDGTTLLELGAQSLQFLEISLRLESMFGVSIDRRLAVPGRQTLMDLVAAVSAAEAP